MASSAIYETRRKMKEESNKSRSRPCKSSFLFVAVNWRLKTPSPKQSSKSSSQCRMLFFTYLKSKWSTKRIPFTAENSKIECKILYKIEQQIAVYVLMKQMFPSLWHAIDTVKCKTFTARKPTQTTIKCQNIFLLLAEAACENAYIFSVNLSYFYDAIQLASINHSREIYDSLLFPTWDAFKRTNTWTHGIRNIHIRCRIFFSSNFLHMNCYSNTIHKQTCRLLWQQRAIASQWKQCRKNICFWHYVNEKSYMKLCSSSSELPCFNGNQREKITAIEIGCLWSIYLWQY